MSLIARLMDRRNRRVISNLAQKQEGHLDDAENVAGELFEKGAYTNGIQDL
ncbi:MAG: hypothetical protein PHT62_00670 [Desulfotomaculaceae bacterium]|nr:hypothetical protein [Desulfotomaculaceae bacterium]